MANVATMSGQKRRRERSLCGFGSFWRLPESGENGNITSGWNLQMDLIIFPFAFVVTLELLPYLVRSYAHDRVESGIVGLITVEDLIPYQIFVQFTGAPIQVSLTNQLEEFLLLRRIRKLSTAENALYQLSYFLSGWRR